MRVADSIAYCRIGLCSKDRDVSQLDASINGHVGCKYGTFSSCERVQPARNGKRRHRCILNEFCPHRLQKGYNRLHIRVQFNRKCRSETLHYWANTLARLDDLASAVVSMLLPGAMQYSDGRRGRRRVGATGRSIIDRHRMPIG